MYKKIFFLGLISLCLACHWLTPRPSVPADYYAEPHRPQIHFSPEQMWMNDPNGLVYYAGEYHLFYQYYPRDVVWGPMHWGHAVSRDLWHWQHLPIALVPDTLGYIFSGSAVVDSHNTAGFRSGKELPMVAMFTYHDMAGEHAGRSDFQSQGIAYSNDRGRTWAKYSSNPVIANPQKIKDFRDPKVFWHAPTQRWVMLLAAGDHVRIYQSKDLKNWEEKSQFGRGYGSVGRPWECPDLFALPIDGSSQTQWVMLVSLGAQGPNGGSATQYFTGQFDGATFTPDQAPGTTLWLDYGKDNYAGVTWNHEPDGRRILMGWMSNWQYAREVPTSPWRSAMTIPRELFLQRGDEGLRLLQRPFRSITTLRSGEPHRPKNDAAYGLKTRFQLPIDAEAEFEISTATSVQSFGFQLNNLDNEVIRAGYDPATKEIFIDRSQSGKVNFSEHFGGRHTAPYQPKNRKIKLRLVADVSSLELFVDDGALAMTELYFSNKNLDWYSLFASGKGAAPKVLRQEISELSSVWSGRAKPRADQIGE